MTENQFILFSDFNCPFCYAMDRRITASGMEDKVSWRGVQHAPHLLTPMAEADPGLARELQVEVRGIHRWAPDLPIAVPRGKPNTARPIAAAAAAFRQDPAHAHQFKSSIYAAFWKDGLDISSQEVLDTLARAAGITVPLDLAAVAPEVARWQGEWLGSGLGSVPSMIRTDGQALVGLAAEEEVRAFLSGIVRAGG